MVDLSHTQRIRAEMPATTAHTYLNTGTFGPLPNCVIQAMEERLHAELQDGRIGAESFQRLRDIYVDARQHVARLLHASSEEIALTDNTGEGMNVISNGISWREGDEVITTNHEHISALAPLYQNRDRYGVVIRQADLGVYADAPLVPTIQALITARTRLISLSHVTWTTGAVLDIQAVARLGREHNIPVLIDGAQSAGAIPIDVKALGVDFYAIPMQKWLCGPDGTGALYVRAESLHYVAPVHVGYWSMKHEEDIEWELEESAQRFEVGGRQTAAVAGQAAILHWLEEIVGYEWLHARISALNSYAYQALKGVPSLRMLTPRAGASGIISFQLEGKDDAEAVSILREKHNIYVRNIPSTKALRISTGFYNTEEEIDRLVQVLTSI